MPIKLSMNEFKKKVEDKFPNYFDEYEFLSDYINTNTKMTIKHLKCGGSFEMDPTHILRGNKCPCCSLNSKWNNSKFQEKLDNICGKGEFELVGEYINTKTKTKIKHLKCGQIFEITPESLLRYKTCPCMRSSKKKSVVNKTSNQNLSNPTINNITVDSAKNKETFKEFIESLNLEFEFEKDFNGVQANYIFENIKTIIQFNIISNIDFDTTNNKKYLNKRMKYFNSLGYRSVDIFEDEWVNKQDLLEKKIKHILQIDNSKRIFAKKCKIKEITDPSLEKKFLDDNHIQGSVRSKYAEGLYYNDELVALISFGDYRICMGKKEKVEGEYELLRYASSCNVIGGFSKLMKYCIKKYNIKKILTYADLRFSDSTKNMYSKNGFTFIRFSEPNYFYYNGLQKSHRFSFRKDKLKTKFPNLYSDSKTETSIMKEAGYKRVYDCGNIVYEMTIKKDDV